MSLPPPPPNEKPPTDTRRLGQGMLIGAWVCGMLLLTAAFNVFTERQRNPNKDVAEHYTEHGAIVTLQMNRSGHYLASGRINGAPVDFLLDTGATLVAIPGHIASTLQLESGPPMQVETANGVTRSYLTRLATVELGALRKTNVRAAIVPGMTSDEVLLGMSFLRDLEWVQQNDRLIIRQPAAEQAL